MENENMFGDLAALLNSDQTIFETGRPAADELGVTDPARRHVIIVRLAAIAANYRHVGMGNASRPRAAEVKVALDVAAAGARQLEGAMATLLRARLTAIDDISDEDNCRRVAFAAATEAIMMTMGLGRPEWLGGVENPLAGRMDSLATALEKLAGQFSSGDFRESTRPTHPAAATLIYHLAEIYSVETGKAASAHVSGNRPEYVPPFVRFVRAFAPVVGLDPEISAKSIARLLVVYPRLDENLDRIGGNDTVGNVCDPS